MLGGGPAGLTAAHVLALRAQPGAVWEDIMGEEFLTRPGVSRIYYNGGDFACPLEWTSLPC